MYKSIIFTLLASLLLSGCGSKRNTHDQVYVPKEIYDRVYHDAPVGPTDGVIIVKRVAPIIYNNGTFYKTGGFRAYHVGPSAWRSANAPGTNEKEFNDVKGRMEGLQKDLETLKANAYALVEAKAAYEEKKKEASKIGGSK